MGFLEEFKPIEINVAQDQSKPNVIIPLEMNSQYRIGIVPVVEVKNANSGCPEQLIVTFNS